MNWAQIEVMVGPIDIFKLKITRVWENQIKLKLNQIKNTKSKNKINLTSTTPNSYKNFNQWSIKLSMNN